MLFNRSTGESHEPRARVCRTTLKLTESAFR